MSAPQIECFMCGCPDNLREVNNQGNVYACKDARGCMERQAVIDNAMATPIQPAPALTSAPPTAVVTFVYVNWRAKRRVIERLV